MDNDLDKKQELRESLMLLKLDNMKLKKNLRFAQKTRSLATLRLEDNIHQLNSILNILRFNTLKNIVEDIQLKNDKEYKNPLSKKLENSNDKESVVYKYFCDRCDYKSKNKTPFDTHMRRHEGIKPYICAICQRTFATKYSLKLHLPKHSDKRSYDCKICNYSTYRPDMLMSHYNRHKSMTVYTCDKCDYQTNKKSKLSTHCNKIHKSVTENQNNSENDLTPCAACENAKDIMKRLENTNLQFNLESSGIDKTVHICDKPYICTICGWAFKTRGSLDKHLKRHTGERSFACDLCDYKSASLHTLKIHKRTHTGFKPYACNYCSFRCTTKGYLTIHVNKHLGLKRYACDKCDYRSIDISKLKVHQKVHHSEEKPFACEKCSFRAKLRSRLKQHMRTHGPRPYVCPHCAKSFTLRMNLQEHEGIHTGNQPFQCKLCKIDRRFTLEVSYKRHLVLHQQKYVCNLCTYKTAYSRDLKRHEKVHLKSSYRPRKHAEKTFQCELCKFKCAQLLSLTKHMNLKHTKKSRPRYLLDHKEKFSNSVTTAIQTPTTAAHTPLILNIPNAQSFQIEQSLPQTVYPLNSIKDYAPTFSIKYGIPRLSSVYSHKPETPLMNMLHLCDLCNYSSTDPADVTVHKKTIHEKPTNFVYPEDFFRGPLM